MLDEAIAQRLVRHVGAEPGRTYGLRGKEYLRQRRGAFNRAAANQPWFVLVDLDRESACAPALRFDWLPRPEDLMCFRVAVRAAEAWLLADAEAAADFLSVPTRRLPSDPDKLPDPKAEVVRLASRSRSRVIRRGLVPRPESGAKVGPEYTSRLCDYVRQLWRPDVAAARSPSLAGCIASLGRLVEKAQGRGSTGWADA
ncbi:MAG: hypothetical protein IRZ11_08820 [Clostridia bacterium]|nr:hypothetical protein [Clostridia bacterium]